MTVVLAAEDSTPTCAAPLVFVGVGERKLELAGLGQPAPDGRFRRRLSGGWAQVALDGEIKRVSTPLDYRLAPGALRVVPPPNGNPAVS
jgi:hypothetical protein